MTTAIAEPELTSITLDSLAEGVHDAWGRYRNHQIAAWQGYLEVGALLLEARTRLPTNQDYGGWFRAQDFGFSYQWAGRLMQCAQNRPAVLEAFETAVSDDKQPPGVNALLRTLHPPATAAAEPEHVELESRPVRAYDPDHKRSAIVEIIVNYPHGVTKREEGSAHGSGAPRAEWHAEIVMQQDIPADAIALGVFARELAMRFEGEVRQRPFLTMRP